MSTITPAFALAVRPVHFDLSERQPGGRIIRMWWENKEYHVAAVHAGFKDEYSAWVHVATAFPDLPDLLKNSRKMDWRAYGLRGEMMLKLGWPRFKEMQDDFEMEIVSIYRQALRALDAVQLTKKATPMVVRVSKTSGVSWLDVRADVQLPYEAEPTTLVVRCLPSPVEEKTWSVRLRLQNQSDSSILETLSRFDELVRNLSYQGITVKDVQNGTFLEL